MDMEPDQALSGKNKSSHQENFGTISELVWSVRKKYSPRVFAVSAESSGKNQLGCQAWIVLQF